MSRDSDAPVNSVRLRVGGGETGTRLRLPIERRSLHEALRRARFNHAAFRTETLVTLVATVAVTTFVRLKADALSLPSWSWAAVLLAGLVATALLIAAALSDPASIGVAIAAELEEHLALGRIGDRAIRGQMSQAVAHRVRMEQMLRAGGGGRGLPAQTLTAVDDWLSGMGRLAVRLECFRAAFELQPESRLPLVERIQDLERRVAESSDRRTTEQLRETLAGRRHQLRVIQELESLVERGLLRLEHAVAALGTINVQLAMFVARDEEGPGPFTPDINAEIREIDAILAALDRVYTVAAQANRQQ